MSYKKSGKEFRLSLKIIILVITALLILSSISMNIYAKHAREYNEKSIELSRLHMKYTDIASDLNLGSHTLTEEVRLFAETGEVKNMLNYFVEVNEMRHRDKAMEQLYNLPDIPQNARNHIEASMRSSLELMNVEYYSMKLATLAYGVPDEVVPDIVFNVELTEEDNMLSADEMKEKARIMLFDEHYMQTKRDITEGTTKFLDSMQENSVEKYFELTRKVELYSELLSYTIFLVSFLILLLTAFLYLYVVRPIARASRDIKKGTKIDMPEFLNEMNSLGTSYNGLMDSNEDLVERLRDMAETDALTKLGNRAAYLNYCNELKKKGGEATIFVFDVNDLRETNNAEGHDAGDKLLKNAADSILNSFKAEDADNCFRIGGDEFVAVVCDENEEAVKLHLKKFKYEQNWRNVSIAVGYVHTKDISKESIRDLFSEADKRMYINKAEIKNSAK